MSENSSLLLQLPNDTQAEITAYITNTLGDTHIDYHTLLPLTLIYSIFLVVGVCGNLATCVVIVSNEYLRTATNVYLLNLALADIATLIIAMPGELYLMWQQYPWTFGEVACDAKIVITEAIIYASILTIVAFTGERYLAICRPLSPLARSTTGEARRVISMIWLFSFLSASPWALFTKRLVIHDARLHSSLLLCPISCCRLPLHKDRIDPPPQPDVPMCCFLPRGRLPR